MNDAAVPDGNGPKVRDVRLGAFGELAVEFGLTVALPVALGFTFPRSYDFSQHRLLFRVTGE